MYYHSDAENTAIKATRKDWHVDTEITPAGRIEVTVASDAGWGNAGPHNFGYHSDAAEARARRIIRKFRPTGPLPLVIQRTTWYGDGVMSSITYSAKAVRS